MGARVLRLCPIVPARRTLPDTLKTGSDRTGRYLRLVTEYFLSLDEFPFSDWVLGTGFFLFVKERKDWVL